MKKTITPEPAENGRENIMRLLGLARRAGKVTAGSAAAEKILIKKKAQLVLLAEDAAVNTAKNFIYLADKAQVPVLSFGTKLELGQWTGSDSKAVLVITDKGFATRLRELISIINHDADEKLSAEMEYNMGS